MSDWISVKDKLPENEKLVLVSYKKRSMDVVWYNHNQKMWMKNFATVTHWMPLPEPPNE